MDYLREWVRNLFIDLAVLVGVAIVMIIFMKIFYPDALSLLVLSGEFAIGMINVLQWWPLVILAAILHAMPRRRRRRS